MISEPTIIDEEDFIEDISEVMQILSASEDDEQNEEAQQDLLVDIVDLESELFICDNAVSNVMVQTSDQYYDFDVRDIVDNLI